MRLGVNSLQSMNTSTTASSSQHKGHRIMTGVLLSFSGHLFISVSINIQKYFLRKTNKPSITAALSNICFMIIAEICNFIAYAYIPVSLLLSLAATTIISNAVLASLLFDEPLRKRDTIGIVLWSIGGFLEVNFTKDRDHWLNAVDVFKKVKNRYFIIYFLVVAVLYVFILYVRVQGQYTDCLTVLLQVAIFGSFAVISTKAVSSMLNLTFRGANQLTHPVFYAMLFLMVVSCVGQVKMLNQAVESYDKALIVQANFVLFTLSGIVGGCIFFQEFDGYTLLELLMFLMGISFTFAGVFFVAGERTFHLSKQRIKRTEETVSETESDEFDSLFDRDLEEKILWEGWKAEGN